MKFCKCGKLYFGYMECIGCEQHYVDMMPIPPPEKYVTDDVIVKQIDAKRTNVIRMSGDKLSATIVYH